MLKRVPYHEWHNSHIDANAISNVSKVKHGVNMWALVHKDGTVEFDEGHSECFYWISYQDRIDTRSVYVALRGDDELSWWWWNNLLSPSTSPWHESLLDNIVYEGGPDEYHVAHIGITDTTPLKNIVNLLIALRQVSEHRANVQRTKKWYDYLRTHDGTATFSEALACSLMKQDTSGGVPCDNEGSFMGGHSPFYTDTVPPRIAQRKPLEYPTLFNSKAGYGSDDDIWGDDTYIGYDPNGYHAYLNYKGKCDRKSWCLAIKQEPLVDSSEPVVSAFSQRIEEQAKANKKDKYHDISVPRLLTMLRTFELKDTVPANYVEEEVDFFLDDDDEELED